MTTKAAEGVPNPRAAVPAGRRAAAAGQHGRVRESYRVSRPCLAFPAFALLQVGVFCEVIQSVARAIAPLIPCMLL
jgi:hypothetical protein